MQLKVIKNDNYSSTSPASSLGFEDSVDSLNNTHDYANKKQRVRASSHPPFLNNDYKLRSRTTTPSENLTDSGISVDDLHIEVKNGKTRKASLQPDAFQDDKLLPHISAVTSARLSSQNGRIKNLKAALSGFLMPQGHNTTNNTNCLRKRLSTTAEISENDSQAEK